MTTDLPMAQPRRAPPNTVQVWSDHVLEPTEYLSASYKDFVFPPHLHEGFAIGVIERGAQRFRPGRKSSLIMPQGSLCVINPGVVHEGRAGVEGGWTYRMFYPSEDLVRRALSIDEEPPWIDRHVLIDDALYGDFCTMHRASRLLEDRLERETRVLIFLSDLFKRHSMAQMPSPRDRQPRTVAIVRSILHDRCAEPISVTELSVEAGVSETQVIRSFSGAIGMAPHAYLIALRIERAKRLIRAGSTLTNVAGTTGFSDQSHLNRHFKRLTGMTPGQFAAQT
jgi:AraC-like DNA-binding protein